MSNNFSKKDPINDPFKVKEFIIGSVKNNGRGNFGYLQLLILYYALHVADKFTPGEIIPYFGLDKQRYQRRIHDALTRLVKRGIVKKIKRGFYELNQHVDLSLKDLESLIEKVAEKEFKKGRKIFSNIVSRWIYDGVMRIHSIGAESFLELFFQIALVKEILPLVVEGLRGHLRKAGFSKRFLSGIESTAKRLAVSMSKGDFIIGGHGLYGGGTQKALIPVSHVERMVSLREIGIDVIVPKGITLPKMHLKIYTSASPYEVRKENMRTSS
ncbi:MAG: hypothetical protein GU359_00990 [Desulfurococcales archaeon]|jgi:hypothetical protein|nr:hypothetical protein [Desulfurococcales archaeon]